MKTTVRTLRKTNNFTIAQISDKLGISTHKYMLYELKPYIIPIDTAILLAKICGVSVDDIFFG